MRTKFPMPTRVIRSRINPNRPDLFNDDARNWGQAIARSEAARARLALDPPDRRSYDFARADGVIRCEDRTVLKLVSAPHGGST